MSSKCQKMKNARAKRAKILFFFVKYANLLGSCCRRRRGCLSSLTIIFQELLFISYQDEAIAKNATNGSFWCSLLHDYSLLTIPPTCFRRLTLEIVTNRVSSSQSLSGGLLDLTKESNNWNKINWTILPENIRLCYQILDHLCLNEQLKNIETWLPKKKKAFSFVHTPFHGYFIVWVTKDQSGDIHSSAYSFLFDFGVFWIFKGRNNVQKFWYVMLAELLVCLQLRYFYPHRRAMYCQSRLFYSKRFISLTHAFFAVVNSID